MDAENEGGGPLSAEEQSRLMSLDFAADPYRDLVMKLRDDLACDRATFFLVDHEKRQVYSKAATLLEIKEIRLPINRGVVGFVARTGRPLNLKDVYNDPRFDRTTDQKTGYRSKSMLAVAIRDTGGTVIGVLQALNKVAGIFTPEDEATMTKACEAALELVHRPA